MKVAQKGSAENVLSKVDTKLVASAINCLFKDNLGREFAQNAELMELRAGELAHLAVPLVLERIKLNRLR